MFIYFIVFLQKAQGTYIYGLNYSCFMSAHLKGQSEKSLFTLLLSYGVVVSLPADDFTLIWINIHKSQYVTINACSIPKHQTSRSLSWTGYITVQLVSSKIHYNDTSCVLLLFCLITPSCAHPRWTGDVRWVSSLFRDKWWLPLPLPLPLSSWLQTTVAIHTKFHDNHFNSC